MNFPSPRTLDDQRRINDAWKQHGLLSFDPAWTGDTSDPAIGNGSLVGFYWREQFTAHVRIYLLIGTTTTFGTGQWRFSIPLSARNEMEWTGDANANDISAKPYSGWSKIYPGQLYLRCYSETAGTHSGFVQAGTPFVWADGDTLRIAIDYPI